MVSIKSPLIREVLGEVAQQTRRESILLFLEGRFGAVLEEVADGVGEVVNEVQLGRLVHFAVVCPTLEAFQQRLRSEAPYPADVLNGKRQKA